MLAGIADSVFTIEIIPALAASRRGPARFARLRQVSREGGDGYFGWPEKAPFDGDNSDGRGAARCLRDSPGSSPMAGGW